MARSKPFFQFLPLVILFVILVLVMPRGAKLRYEYKKGAAWKYETLVAPFDFPVFKTDAQLSEEQAGRSDAVLPYFRYAEDVSVRSLTSVESLDLGTSAYLKPVLSGCLRELLARGIVEDSALPVSGSGAAGMIYIQREKNVAKYPASEVFRLSEARQRLSAELLSVRPGLDTDSLLLASGAAEFLVPNLIYDAQASQLLHAREMQPVSPTSGYVRTGETIVSKGELVTAEIAQVLDSYKKEYEQNVGYGGPAPLYMLGNAILALVLVLMLYFAIRFSNPEILEDKGLYFYLLLVSLVFLLVSILAANMRGYQVYLIPFTLCALFLEAFFDNRLIITVYSITLLPLLFYVDSGVVLFVMFLTAGVVSIFCFKYLNKGWRQFLNAFITFLVLLGVYLAFRLTEAVGGNIFRVAVALFAGSMLSVAGYPLTYLF